MPDDLRLVVGGHVQRFNVNFILCNVTIRLID